MKLGAVFTQTSVDEEGRPVRDEAPTIGAIETAEQFGRRLYTEAWESGWIAPWSLDICRGYKHLNVEVTGFNQSG